MAKKPVIPLESAGKKFFVGTRTGVGTLTLRLGLHDGDLQSVAIMQDVLTTKKPLFGILMVGNTDFPRASLNGILGLPDPHLQDVPLLWRVFEMLTRSYVFDTDRLAELMLSAMRNTSAKCPASFTPMIYKAVMAATMPAEVNDMIVALNALSEPLDADSINRELMLGTLAWDDRLAKVPGVLSPKQQRQKAMRTVEILHRYEVSIAKFLSDNAVIIFDRDATRKAIEMYVVDLVTRGVEASQGSDLVMAYAALLAHMDDFDVVLDKAHTVMVDPTGLMEEGFFQHVAQWAGAQSKRFRTGAFCNSNKRSVSKFLALMQRLDAEVDRMPVTRPLYDSQ